MSQNRTSAEEAEPKDRESLNLVTSFEILDVALPEVQSHQRWLSDTAKQKYSDYHMEAEQYKSENQAS